MAEAAAYREARDGPIGLAQDGVADRHESRDEAFPVHTAGTSIKIDDCGRVRGTERPDARNRGIDGRISRCPGLMLVDRSNGLKALAAVEGKSFLGGVEKDRAITRLPQQAVHQDATNALVLHRRRYDNHAECRKALAIGPPQGRPDDAPIRFRQDTVSQARRDSPVVLAIGPVHRAGQGERAIQISV